MKGYVLILDRDPLEKSIDRGYLIRGWIWPTCQEFLVVPQKDLLLAQPSVKSG